MLGLIKYAARIQLKNRVVSMILLAAACAAVRFLTLNAGSAVTQTILMLAGPIAIIVASVLVVTFNFLADAASLRNMFTAPSGYLPMLAPVPGWKLLSSRALTIVVFDCVCFALGYAGTMFLASSYTSVFSFNNMTVLNTQVTIFTWLGFIQLVMTVFLACALAKSVFFGFRNHAAAGIISFFLIQYALSLLDVLLAPFAACSGSALTMRLHIIMGFNAGVIAYFILSFLKILGLFFITARLIERKVNI